MHGQGTFIFKKGGKYVGEHRDGKPHGHGTLTHGDGKKETGNFYDGKLVQ